MLPPPFKANSIVNKILVRSNQALRLRTQPSPTHPHLRGHGFCGTGCVSLPLVGHTHTLSCHLQPPSVSTPQFSPWLRPLLLRTVPRMWSKPGLLHPHSGQQPCPAPEWPSQAFPDGWNEPVGSSWPASYSFAPAVSGSVEQRGESQLHHSLAV